MRLSGTAPASSLNASAISRTSSSIGLSRSLSACMYTRCVHVSSRRVLAASAQLPTSSIGCRGEYTSTTTSCGSSLPAATVSVTLTWVPIAIAPASGPKTRCTSIVESGPIV